MLPVIGLDKRNAFDKAKLKRDSDRMISKYFNICKGLQNFIKTNSIEIQELKWIFHLYRPRETIKETDCHRSITSDDIEKMDKIANLMSYISSFSSFFNFELVEEIIDIVDYKEGKQLMKQYKNYFNEYLKRRITQCPAGIGMKGSDHVHFLIQLDNTYKDCRMSHLLALRDDICEILDIKKHCLHLEGLNQGSIWVVFHLLKLQAVNIFPLPEESIYLISMCRYMKARILMIKCGDLSYKINSLSIGM